MKSILFIIILMIMLNKAYQYIYIQGLENNWMSYIIFSLIVSFIFTILQFYMFEHWGELTDNMISAVIIAISTFTILILYPLVRSKMKDLSE